MNITFSSPYAISACSLQMERKRWLRNRFPRLKGKVKSLEEVRISWLFSEGIITETITVCQSSKKVTFVIEVTESEQKEVLNNLRKLYRIVDQGYIGMSRYDLYTRIRREFRDVQIRNDHLIQYSASIRLCLNQDGTYVICAEEHDDFPKASLFFAEEVAAFIKQNRLTWVLT